jgi:hypothetical protein
VRLFLEETDARLQALLTAYEPERVFAETANAVSERVQPGQPYHLPVSAILAGAALNGVRDPDDDLNGK